MGLLLRYVTASTGFFGLSRLGRLVGLKSGSAYAQWLEEQKQDALAAIVVGHGPPVQGNADCKAALNEAIGRL
jgi:hypothetical protein